MSHEARQVPSWLIFDVGRAVRLSIDEERFIIDRQLLQRGVAIPARGS